ncbi:DNA-binding protein [Paraburkholderia xenovorans]|uniref:DNA-binding protein n=1 Tax=Paraburkholderia xenovorans TaxID=36873 RepID=UPI001558646B|nr:DNA-binding protein [Paraburkholderia xenovorans]NPT36727.1 ATPase [Paraburkholderia xenovorans]
MSTDADTITDEQIAAIADRMVEEGRRVSPVTIWKEVRGGSLVAIVAALQRWREARQGETPALQVQPGLPEGLAETVMSAADRIWSASQHDAERAFSQRLAAVNQDLEAAVAERDEALAEYQKMIDEVETGRQRVIALTDTLSASESIALRLEAELATVTGRAEAAETHVEELAQRALAQDADLEAIKASFDEERLAREESATALASKNDEVAQLTQERDQARHEIVTLSDVCHARTEEVTQWSQEARAASSRAELAEARIEELVQRAAVDHANLEAMNASLEAERKAREELAAVVSGKTDELTRVIQEREQALQHVTTLDAACQANAQEVTRWSQEANAATSRAQAAEARIEELVQRVSSQDAGLEAAKASLEEERKGREELAAVVSSKTDELTRVTQERDQTLQQIATLSQAHQVKSEEVTRLSGELSAAAARAQAAEARVEELAQHATSHAAEQQATVALLDEERKARAELATAISGKSDELAQAAQERDQAQQQIVTLSDAHQAKSEEAIRLSAELGAALSHAKAAEVQASGSLAKLAALEAELEQARASLAAECEAAAARADEMSVHLNDLQRVTQELEETRQQIGTMNEAKAVASADLARVSQDASAAKERAEAAEQQVVQLEQRLAAQAAAVAQQNQRAQQASVRADEAERAEEVAALQRQIAAQARANAKALSELRATAEQWVAHAKDLKQRLGLASERILFIDARSTGEVALVRRLSSELERLKPDHELIARETQQKLIGATMSHQLAQKGYRYDPATAVMSKVTA